MGKFVAEPGDYVVTKKAEKKPDEEKRDDKNARETK
jgi:hypothetical protein